MAEQTLNVRLQLKYDTHANWVKNNPILKKGELAIATLPVGDSTNTSTELPAVVIKAGDGQHNYVDLPIIHGKAADVYSWAKAKNKPTYTAAEIGGIEAIDTDTQYNIVKVNDYQYKLQSKAKGAEAWSDVEGVVINIPKYDDTNVKANITALQALVGETAVSTQIANAIAALNLNENYAAKTHTHVIDDVTGLQDALDGKQAVGDYATKAEAQEYANKKVASVTANDASVTVGGTTTAPKIGVKISADAANKLTLAEDGLKVEIPAADTYTIEKATNSGDYAAVYNLKKNGTPIGDAINIPKDMVVESGSVVENPKGQPAGTYIELKLQNVTEPIYINVGNLIEYVTSGSKTGDMIVVAVSDDHKVTATITDGTITLAKLDTATQTKINKAHDHTNKTVLDGITEEKVANWDTASTKAHEHTNKAILDAITAAPILTTDTLILNCGDSEF